MKRNLLYRLALVLLVIFASCKKDDAPYVPGKYEQGFFVANEGWFGHDRGDLHFYSYAGDSLVLNVYQRENPEDSLGTPGNTLQYATIFNNKMYIVVKAGGPLVVTDAYTMKETGRIEKLPGNNGYAFAGIDAGHGLLSSTDGVYPVSLPGLALGSRIAGVEGTVGDMLKAGKYVFLLSAKDGIVVLDAGSYAVVKKLGAANIGFAMGKDGAVWAASRDSLLKIDPATLSVTKIKLPFTVASPWGAWRHAPITASTRENVVFLTKGIGFNGGNSLYRYKDNDATSLSEPFITLPGSHYFYGGAVAYNSDRNELVLNTINGPFTGNINSVLIYDAGTGSLKKTITYHGWYFPAMTVFH